ncbi:MAG TPA: CHAT domain-containing protein, partial [Gemmatimonadales bacterium]|nr:CHAT domain-containing protein [Gemmatimonadales bacterium]
SGDEPRSVVQTALAAVEGDSAAPVAARWEARLRQHPDDRAAQLGLATLARYQYRYDEADRRYRALDSLSPPDPFAVYARLGLGAGADARGLQAQSDSAFRRALAGARLIGDRRAESEALLNLAYLVATVRGLDDGMAYLDSAQRVIPTGARDLAADEHRRRAVLLAVQSDSGAMAEAEACMRLARPLGELRLMANCLRSAALDLNLRGLSDSSLVILKQAAQLHRRAHDHALLAETLLREVDIFRGNGAFGDAKRGLDEALAEARISHNLLALAAGHTSRGSLAMRVQDFATAGEEFPQAIQLFRQQGDPAGVMLARSFLPTLYAARGQLDAAIAEADSTIQWYRGTGEVPNQFEMLRTRASLAMRAHDWSAADSVLGVARRLAAAHDRDIWRGGLELDEGRLALYRGALTEAARHLRTYLSDLDSTAHVSQHEARLRLAEIYARQGNLARSEQELSQADHALDRWRATLADRDLRVLAFQAMPTEDFENHASAARVLGLLSAAGQVDTAFAFAERRRARELADRIAQADALRAGRVVPGLGDRIRRQAAPATVADVKSALPDDSTAFLEFVAGTGNAPSTLFVITRNNARAYRLRSTDSLAAAIDRFSALLESGDDPGALARKLGAALLDSALAGLPPSINRLIIVPDGRLYRVPFDALALPNGKPLITRYAMSSAPSGAVAIALWRRPPRHDSNAVAVRLLAFGDPAFAGEEPPGRARGAGEYRAAFAMRAGLPRLAGSGREVRDVARYAPDAVVRLRADASEAYLKRTNLRPFSIIHFATHALVDDARLDRTALALAPGGGEDGFVTPAELSDLQLNADLVVLSACRTAGGKVVQGEGVEGLTAPLLAAGARSVLATKWRVSDDKTEEMVDDFYRALAGGQSVGSALRTAKLEAIHRGVPVSQWAAFTVIGDANTRVPLSEPHGSPMIWVIAAAGGLVILGGAVLLRRVHR